MSEDMSELFQKVNQMLKNNEIPDELKNMMNQFASSTSDNSTTSSTSDSSNIKNHISSQREPNSNENDDNSNNNFQFDMNTMLKMKSIIDTLNRNQNDPRSNLLKSLKPYLKPSRKEKVDQYIQLFNMGKEIEVMYPLEGEKKNDVKLTFF